MNKFVVVLVAVIALSACSKNKKYCWECRFDRGTAFKALDTIACDMTEEESKIWQQKIAERQLKDYGPATSSPASFCRKTNR